MNEFLEQYRVKVKTLAPVFIGSGESLTKKEYLYEPESNKVLFLNFGKMFSEIKTGKLARELRKYFMQENKMGLKEFLDKQDGITIKPEWIKHEYSVKGAELLFEDKKFKGISLFMKDAYENPYIPGSSLKGAIRTALLKDDIQNHPEKFEKKLSGKECKKAFSKQSKEIEEKGFFVELATKEQNKKKVSYDIMKGILVSDSKPLSSNALTLCQKIDGKHDGNENKLPILRECLKPDTEIEFLLTIDQTYYKGGIERIKQAIQCSFRSARAWIEEFSPMEMKSYDSEELLYLGGGSGYISKTVTYDLFHKEDAKKVAMKSIPKPGKTDRYSDIFVPRTIKKTQMNGEYYDMGLCKIEFERIE